MGQMVQIPKNEKLHIVGLMIKKNKQSDLFSGQDVSITADIGQLKR